jgi:hypothetical protein
MSFCNVLVLRSFVRLKGDFANREYRKLPLVDLMIKISPIPERDYILCPKVYSEYLPLNFLKSATEVFHEISVF